MSRSSKLLFELSRRVEGHDDGRSLPRIRQHFADLMDLAAAELTRRGMDQDDCEVVRMASIRDPASSAEVEFVVQGLSSAVALLSGSSLARSTMSEGEALRALTAVEQVWVKVIQDVGAPFGPAWDQASR